MSGKNTITQETEDLILELRLDPERPGRQRSTREISALLAEKGILASHTTVAKVIQEHQHERKEIIRDEIRERVATKVLGDVDVLGELLTAGLEVWRASRPQPKGCKSEIKMAAKDWIALGKAIQGTVMARVAIASGEDTSKAESKGFSDLLKEAIADFYPLARKDGEGDGEGKNLVH